MNRKPIFLISVFPSVLSLLIPMVGIQGTGAVTSISGSSCNKINTTETISSTKYICVKVGKKLTWVRVPLARITPTPSTRTTNKVAPTPSASKSSAKPSASSTPSSILTKNSDKKLAAFTTKIGPNVEITLGTISDPFRNLSGGLIIDGTSTTPTNCVLIGGTLSILNTGSCSVIFPASDGPNTATSSDLQFSFKIVKPALTAPNDQIESAKSITRVPPGQTFTTSGFEFSILSISDNSGDAICTDDPETNEGCIKDSSGAGIIDPKAKSRYVKIHLKMTNSGKEILTPSADFKLLLGHVVYDVSTVVTLEILNGQDINPGATLEGDYYFYLPKNVTLTGGFVMPDDTFTRPQEVVLFAY